MKSMRKKLKTTRPGYRAKEAPLENLEDIIQKVKVLAEPLCEAEGMELVHVEFQREPVGRILRVYIDKPGRVTLDDCVLINRQLGDLLDVNLESEESYNLEVSSPGFDRPLGKKHDFEKFEGKTVRIKTCEPVDGQKNFKGILMGISGEIVKLSFDGKIIAIPFQKITKARLVGYNGENGC